MPSELQTEVEKRVRVSGPLIALNAAYAGLLVALAVVPSIPGAGVGVSDTVVHAAVYGVQALMLFLMLNAVLPATKALAAAWIGATGFGLITEALQLFRPERSVEFKDVIANAIGAGLVVVLVVVMRRFRPTGRTD